MKKRHYILSSAIIYFIFASCAFADKTSDKNCVACKTAVEGMPTNSTISTMEKIADKMKDNDSGLEEYSLLYCLKFQQIEKELVTTTLNEMSESPYPMDNYFKVPRCQVKGYSNVVKSPVFHTFADDPTARETYLSKISRYYEKKNKADVFTAALNAKNTKGETFLDYIKTLVDDGKRAEPEQKIAIKNIIQFACSKGAVYAFYKNQNVLLLD